MTRLRLVPERRDRLGRRIGYNWWREMCVNQMRDYNFAIAALDGENHQMEPDEFRAAHPLVTFKQCLIGNAGMFSQAEQAS